MNPAEIIVHEVKCDRMPEIFDFLGKAVCESRKSPHPHPHSQIVALNEARRDNGHIGFANHRFFARMETHGRAIASFVSFALSAAIEFNKHRVVNIGTKHTFNRFQIGAMAVRRKLDAVGKAIAQIADKLKGVASIALAHEPARNKFRVGVNSDPSPNIAKPRAVGRFDVLLFLANKPPHFVALNPLAGKIAQNRILIIGAGFADHRNEIKNRIKGNVAHTRRSSDGVTFNDCANDLDSLLSVQFVHAPNLCLSGQEVKGQNEIYSGAITI